ncbi:MAG: RsmE family RNA methyltransferase [Candidatus Gracilibacteria bacterium]
MQHFFVNEDLGKGAVTIRDEDVLHQLTKVLRFRAGDECVLLDGKGGKAKGMIEELHKEGAQIKIEKLENFERPNREVRLFAAVSKKPETFELIVQKATELGATMITPLLCARCQVDSVRKPERVKKIIKEAAEQAERIFLPEMGEVVELGKLAKNLPDGRFLVGDARDYDEKLGGMDFDGSQNLVIGPEGGLTAEEIAMVRKAGGVIFLANENVLRMETAAIAALAIVQAKCLR